MLLKVPWGLRHQPSCKEAARSADAQARPPRCRRHLREATDRKVHGLEGPVCGASVGVRPPLTEETLEAAHHGPHKGCSRGLTTPTCSPPAQPATSPTASWGVSSAMPSAVSAQQAPCTREGWAGICPPAPGWMALFPM